jgi:predicted amidohydrolase
MSYQVSVLQYRPQLLKAEENFARISTMLSELDTDLVVLPELALSGYVFSNVSELPLVAESIPEGRIFNGFRDLARARNMSIVYGFAESAGDQYYNSCALVNPDGSFYIYRKIHLFNRKSCSLVLAIAPLRCFQGKVA